MFAAIVTAVVVVVAFAFVYNLANSKDHQAKQQLKSTPWADIAEAPTGADIRLTGRLAFFKDESLSAPMSGRKCAAWRIVIEEEYREGLRNHQPSIWETVVDECESVDFLVTDDTGRARVEGTHVTLVADFDDAGGAELFRELPADLEALLEKRGVQTSNWWSSQHNFRYRESALEVDEVVTVAGCGRWENDPNQSAGGPGVGKIFRLGPLESGELVVGDDPDLNPHRPRPV